MIQGQTLENLKNFAYGVDGDSFTGYFYLKTRDKSLSKHLWRKFREEYNYDLIRFWAYLDLGNRRILLSMINEYTKLGVRKFYAKYSPTFYEVLD